jgi:hypothetical protein
MALRLLYPAAWLTDVPACPVTASSQGVPVPSMLLAPSPCGSYQAKGKLNFLAVDMPKGSGQNRIKSGVDGILTICMTE